MPSSELLTNSISVLNVNSLLAKESVNWKTDLFSSVFFCSFNLQKMYGKKHNTSFNIKKKTSCIIFIFELRLSGVYDIFLTIIFYYLILVREVYYKTIIKHFCMFEKKQLLIPQKLT